VKISLSEDLEAKPNLHLSIFPGAWTRGGFGVPKVCRLRAKLLAGLYFCPIAALSSQRSL
jgi:hypothetical protein